MQYQQWSSNRSGSPPDPSSLCPPTPGTPPPPHTQEAICDPSTYQYCLKSATRPLRQAAVDWYARLYGVALDPDTQALSLMGTQVGDGGEGRGW